MGINSLKLRGEPLQNWIYHFFYLTERMISGYPRFQRYIVK